MTSKIWKVGGRYVKKSGDRSNVREIVRIYSDDDRVQNDVMVMWRDKFGEGQCLLGTMRADWMPIDDGT